MKINLTQKIIATLSVLLVSSTGFAATNYSTPVFTYGGNITLQNGDTVIINEASYLGYVVNAREGTITVKNPATDGIYVSVGTSKNPILNTGGDFYSGGMRPVISQINSYVNLGTNTTIETFSDSANVTATGILATTNSSVIAGDNLTIRFNGTYGTGSYGISAINDSSITIGDNLKVYAAGGGNIAIMVSGGGNITVGDNAYIEAGLGLNARINSSITMQNSTIRGVGSNGVGINTAPGGIIDITNSDIYGERNAITVPGVGGPTGIVTVSGGTLTSDAGAVIGSGETSETSNASSSTVIIKDGAKASSLTGVFFEGELTPSVGSELEIKVMGSDTIVEGRFLDGTNLDTTFSISDGATWNSVGASNMDSLSLEDANINIVLTSASDRIVTDNLTLDGTTVMNVGLTNEFLEEVIAMGLPQDFDVSIVASFTDGTGTIAYDIATSNDEGSTWSIDDLGNGIYRIYDITLVPEPSTYAMIFGALALALAIYRRRK